MAIHERASLQVYSLRPFALTSHCANVRTTELTSARSTWRPTKLVVLAATMAGYQITMAVPSIAAWTTGRLFPGSAASVERSSKTVPESWHMKVQQRKRNVSLNGIH